MNLSHGFDQAKEFPELLFGIVIGELGFFELLNDRGWAIYPQLLDLRQQNYGITQWGQYMNNTRTEKILTKSTSKAYLWKWAQSKTKN